MAPTKRELLARIEALEAEVAILRARPIIVVQPQPLSAPTPYTSPFTPPWGTITSGSLDACTVKCGPPPMVWN